jgi:hypothetical protein
MELDDHKQSPIAASMHDDHLIVGKDGHMSPKALRLL